MLAHFIYKCCLYILLQDIYHANIDCQWLDVTELPTGTYTFKLSINPEYKVISVFEVGVDSSQYLP